MIAPFVHESRAARVVFGRGRRSDLPAEVAALGFRRVLVISTPGHSSLGRDAVAMLGPTAALFDGAVMHVPADVVERGVAAAQSFGADGCVAVGGGSTIGLAKAITLQSGLPSIAIPTTYAGSEMTPLYGITEAGEKRTGRDWAVTPRTIIYDPELTLSLPAAITVSSGINAVAHAVEALYAPNGSPLHHLMAENGIRAFAKALPALIDAPEDVEIRGLAQFGTWLCGSVLGQLQMGLHHKICHVLGGSFNLPHAETHTVILPHALNYNAPAVPEAIAVVSRALGGSDLEDWYHALSAPTSLAGIGMPEHHLDRAADLICANSYPNPRPFKRKDIRTLLQNAFDGVFPARFAGSR